MFIGEYKHNLEWQVILLQAQIDRLKEPQILTALQENGCQRSAELYEKLMRGEFIAGSHQGLLCTALRADVREHGSCQRFSYGCEAQLCLTEPHQGCTALRRAEDSHGYVNIKAPVPAADRQGQGSQTN